MLIGGFILNRWVQDIGLRAASEGGSLLPSDGIREVVPASCIGPVFKPPVDRVDCRRNVTKNILLDGVRLLVDLGATLSLQNFTYLFQSDVIRRLTRDIRILAYLVNPVKRAPRVSDHVGAPVKSNGSNYQILSEYLMNHSAGNRIQAVLLAFHVIRKVPVDVHRLRHLVIFVSEVITLELLMIVIDALLPLVEVVPDCIGHWRDYYLT